jgi:hypothetical protein
MKYKAPPNATNLSFEQDVYTVVDGVVDCPPSFAAKLGLQPIADAAPADDKPSGILALNADKAKALVAEQTDQAELEKMAVAEGQNPKGARKGVLEAITAKLAELTKK